MGRFRKMYVDGGLLPDLVFKIRAVGTSKCMLRNGQGYSMRDCQHAGWFHLGNMIPEDHPTVDKDGYVEEGVFTVSAKQEVMKKQITCCAQGQELLGMPPRQRRGLVPRGLPVVLGHV